MLTRVCHSLVILGLLGAAAATLLGFAGGWHWFFDLFNHFRAQYLLALLVVSPLALLIRRRMLSAIGFAALVVNIVLIAPLYFGGEVAAKIAGPKLKILLVNVHTSNTDHQKVAALIKRYDPDVVGLLEVNRRWLQAMAPVFADWPPPIARARNDNFGLALWSKRGLKGHLQAVGWDGPSIVAEVDGPLGKMSFVLIHPPPPIGDGGAKARNGCLKALAELRKELPSPLVVMGDFNATPWSSQFCDFLERSKLSNTRDGFGILPSWPSYNPLLRIPIDHILIDQKLAAVQLEISDDVGSDHYGVYAELRLR